MTIQDIDFNQIARQLRKLPSQTQPGQICKIYGAIESLRSELPFPPGYLDLLRDDMVNVLLGRESTEGLTSPTFVYLAFFGTEGRASYMKVGVAKDIRKRMGSIATGNPLPNLWTFAAPFATRVKATAVEAELLRHASPDKVHGEWIHVQGLSLEAAQEIVASLGEVAEPLSGAPVSFRMAEV